MAKQTHYKAAGQGVRCTYIGKFDVGTLEWHAEFNRATSNVENVTCSACKLYIIGAIRRNV